MTLKKRLDRLSKLARLEKLSGERTSKELLYAHMLTDALKIRGIKYPPLFPIAGAANYSLLYLIFRIVDELSPVGVLELGIGQSTLILDAMNADGLSIEHDEQWAQFMRGKVTREIICTPLKTREVQGVTTTGYTYDGDQTFEFAIVDGPQGEERNSRWGALEILNRSLAEDFIVIFDDAERKGEQDTAMAFHKMRGGKDHIIRAASSQCIIYSDKFAPVGWF